MQREEEGKERDGKHRRDSKYGRCNLGEEQFGGKGGMQSRKWDETEAKTLEKRGELEEEEEEGELRAEIIMIRLNATGREKEKRERKCVVREEEINEELWEERMTTIFFRGEESYDRQ